MIILKNHLNVIHSNHYHLLRTLIIHFIYQETGKWKLL